MTKLGWWKHCWVPSYDRTHLQAVVPWAFLVAQNHLGSCASHMKCRSAQMLLWGFLICTPISGKQLYFTFTCDPSLVACLSLGTGILSWSLPTDSQAGGIFGAWWGAQQWVHCSCCAQALDSAGLSVLLFSELSCPRASHCWKMFLWHVCHRTVAFPLLWAQLR